MVTRTSIVHAILAGVALMGCAGTQAATIVPVSPGKPVVEFPSRKEVESLSAGNIEIPKRFPTTDGPRWQIVSTIPIPGLSYPIETYWDRLLGEQVGGSALGAASASGTRSSPELRCAAAEAARFYVEHGVYPGDATLTYLALRCGSTVPLPAFAALQAPVSDGVPLGRIETEFAANVKTLLEQATSAPNRDVGIGFSRGNGRAAVVIVVGDRRGRLEGFSPVVSGVGVTLKGEIDGQWSIAVGLVTRGALDVAVCEPDAKVAPPKFQIFCPLSTQAESARIEVIIRRPKRVLYEPAIGALVRRNDEVGLGYEPLLFGPDAVAADGTAFREALIAALNDARKAAGIGPVVVDSAQSAWIDRVTPAFYRAWLGNDPQAHEQTALGILAGWEVNGTIRDAGMFARVTPSERRPGRWLGGALERPFGRLVLLDKTMSRVAVGAVDLGESGSGVLLTTYALFDDADDATARATLRKTLTAQRAAYGRSPPKFREPSPALVAALERIRRQRISAASALNGALADYNAMGIPVNGAYFEAIDLREMSWLSELLGPPTLDIELGVTHYKPQGAAWGQYAVLVIVHPSAAADETY